MLRAREVAVLERRLSTEREILEHARQTSITPDAAAPLLASSGDAPLAHSVRVAELAKRPPLSLADLLRAAGRAVPDTTAALTVELELKYSGYFERERTQADRLRKMRDVALPIGLPCSELRTLSTEARQSWRRFGRRRSRKPRRFRGSAPRTCRTC